MKYRGAVYAHDFDSDIRRQLRPEIERLQKLRRRLHWFGRLNRSRSGLLNALNPFNYISMGSVLNLGRFSGDFSGRRTWHCGAHTLINSQETCFVTGLVTARQLGADYPFRIPTRKWFNFYGRMMYGWRFRKA